MLQIIRIISISNYINVFNNYLYVKLHMKMFKTYSIHPHKNIINISTIYRKKKKKKY